MKNEMDSKKMEEVHHCNSMNNEYFNDKSCQQKIVCNLFEESAIKRLGTSENQKYLSSNAWLNQPTDISLAHNSSLDKLHHNRISVRYVQCALPTPLS